jgi:transcriptional regulator NrdR family protein
MKCPECFESMRTKDTRQWKDTVKDFDWVERRRVCPCGYRVMTIEMPKEVWAKYSEGTNEEQNV